MNSLEKLNEEITVCDQCKINKPKVLGEGSTQASLAIIGIAPGQVEVREGRPFVGPSGKKLREVLDLLNNRLFFDVYDYIYITNLVKCYPGTEKRVEDPTKTMIKNCGEYLIKELELFPRLNSLLVLGEIPSSFFRLRKGYPSYPVPIKVGERLLACFRTYHPSYLVRTKNREAIRHFKGTVVKAFISSYLVAAGKY